MAEFPALPLFTDALLADTEHLSNEEFGVYIRLLIMIWRNANCSVPNDDAWLMRKLKVNESDYKSLYKPLIKEFLQTDGNSYTQKRLRKEFEYLRKLRVKNSVSAKSRWNKDKGARSGNAPHPTPPTSGSKEPPVDFKKLIFDEGLRYISSATKRAMPPLRTMLGRWCSLYGDAAVLNALVIAQKNSPVEAISYIENILKDGANGTARNASGAATKKGWSTAGKSLADKYEQDARNVEGESESRAPNQSSLRLTESIREE